jgi:hypothetical protein
VDYGPVVFPSHIEKVFHVKIVCLVLVVFGYIFSAYILLYFIVSYRFTQRGSFVYCCFSQHLLLNRCPNSLNEDEIHGFVRSLLVFDVLFPVRLLRKSVSKK